MIDIIRGDEIFDREMEPARHIVAGLVPEGSLVIIAGRPKGGKTWMVLDMMRAIDSGASWAGMPTMRPPGRMLYIALEDGERRIWSRLRAMEWRPSSVDFAFALPAPIGAGGEVAIGEAVMAGYALIAIDTLRAALGPADEGDNNIMGALMNMLGQMAHRDGVTLLMTHHVRKQADAQDMFAAMRGASAIRGAYDVGIILTRAHGERIARIAVEGRDIPDTDPISIEWRGPRQGWRAIPSASQHAHAAELIRREIVDHVRQHGAIGVRDAAEIVRRHLTLAPTTAEAVARRVLGDLTEEGILATRVTLGGGPGRPANMFVLASASSS